MHYPPAVCVGTLDDDPTSLAGKIKQNIDQGHRTVWADENGRVYIDDPLRTDGIDPAWMVGTFNAVQPLRDIEGDLRALQNERSTDSMVDRRPFDADGVAVVADAVSDNPFDRA